MINHSKLISLFPLLFLLSGFIAGGELVWAQGLVALALYPAVLILVSAQLLAKRPDFPRCTLSQVVFLLALVLLVLLAELQGNPWLGWAPLKADALRHSASTWLLLAYSIFFIWVVRNRQSVIWVLGALVVVALLHVFFGAAFLASGLPGYFVRGEYNDYTSLQGGFFNKNSFAAFLNLALFAALGLYINNLSKAASVPGEGWRKLLRTISDLFVSGNTKFFFVCLVFYISLMASYSRAGLGLSVLGGALFFGACLLVLERASLHLKSKLKIFFSIFVVVIICISLAALLLARLMESSELDTRTKALALEAANVEGSNNPNAELDSGEIINIPGVGLLAPSSYQDTVLGRIQPALDGLGAIAEKQWLGVGANNFQWVFMPHRTERSADGYYKYAHSDAIQFLIESGIIGLTLYGVVLLVPLLAGFRVLVNPSRSTGTKSVILGCMVGVLVVFFHSFIDFPFQIFGVVLPLITLLNVLLVLSAPPLE